MKQKYLLDTDTVSYFLKKDLNVVEQIKKIIQKKESLGTSIITHYEILSGLKFKYSDKFLKSYILFSKEIQIFPITNTSVEVSSDLYSQLRKKGNPLDDMDILIAGIAIANKQILVTGNESHFSRIKNLVIENWIER